MKEKTKIWVYSVTPFRNDFENVIWFKNKIDMDNFFEVPNPQMERIFYADDFQQIGRNGEIVLKGRVEKFETATYMRFENNGRMMYAFIYDALYENEGATSLIYEIDVFNTYQLELFADGKPENRVPRISAQIEQMTIENSLSTVMNSSQGFQQGTFKTTKVGELGLTTEWLVVVAKPTIQLSTRNKLSKTNMSFSGMQKAFKYFIIPIDLDKKMTIPFKIGSNSVKSYSLLALYKHLFGVGDKDGETSANNLVNMYVTRGVGLNYHYDGDTLVIDTKIEEYEIVDLGSNVTTATTTPRTGGTGVVTGDDGDVSTLDGRVRALTRAIYANNKNATANGIASIAGCFDAESSVSAQRYETDFATGYKYDIVAKDPTAETLMGSWGGFLGLYGGSGLYEAGYLGSDGRHWIGIGLGQWTGPRCEELFKFAQKNGKSIFSFSTQVGFMFTESRASTVMDISSSTADTNTLTSRFLAEWEGVAGNKLAQRQASASSFVSIVQSELDSLKAGGQGATGTPETDRALANLKAQTGRTLGSGQCYGLTSWYTTQFSKHPSLGGGINSPYPDGNGQQEPNSNRTRGWSASNIGGDYDWAKYGWSVDFHPTSFSQLRVGDIVNYKPYYSGMGTTDAGHTAVIIAVNGSSYTVAQQNWNFQQFVRWGDTYTDLNAISSVIHTPEVTAGGAPSDKIEASNSSVDLGNGTRSYTAFEQTGALLYIKKFYNAEPKVFEIPNLLRYCFETMKHSLEQYSGIEDIYIEYQLLNAEFCEVELYDLYGNSYIYQPQFLPKSLDENYKYHVMVNGSIGDGNHTHIGLRAYNNAGEPDYGDINILDPKNDYEKRWLKNNPEHLRYGFMDVVGKDLTILNDSVATWYQSNKHQNEATQASFKENKDMMNKQIKLSNKQVNQANKEASYNSGFALQTAKTNQLQSGVNAVGGIMGATVGGFATGGLIGAGLGLAKSGIGAGFDMYNAGRQVDNAQQQREFAGQNNMLRKQSNNLSNMQSKLALKQSIRAYNASIADLQNQPISVQQVGNDLSFQSANDITDVYWRVGTMQVEMLYRAWQYISQHGVIINFFTNDLVSNFNHRERFHYVKCISVDIERLPANQSHIDALSAIFQTGVRIWNYEDMKEHINENPFNFSRPNKSILEHDSDYKTNA